MSTTQALTEEKLLKIFNSVIPPLHFSLQKGSSGRVVVLGGSQEYTGAPYYAAMAALRTGSDLATVICAPEALIPIKSYSPELMVSSFENKDFLIRSLKSCSAVVIGW